MKQNFALICIDLQEEYFNRKRPLFIAKGTRVLKNVVLLLQKARQNKIPIIHIKHISSNPKDTAFNAHSSYIKFMIEVAPQKNEYVFTKSLPGAFSNPKLDALLKSLHITNIIICGLTSFLCCDTTSREAHGRGYNVYFVKDATAALDLFGVPAKQVHKVVCSIQKWYFAKVYNTKQLLEKIIPLSNLPQR